MTKLTVEELTELLRFTFYSGAKWQKDSTPPPVYFEHIGRKRNPDFDEWFEAVFKKSYKILNEETAKDLPKCNCHDLQYGNERPCPVHG